jgi:hypothetical protein
VHVVDVLVGCGHSGASSNSRLRELQGF